MAEVKARHTTTKEQGSRSASKKTKKKQGE
jgi:hypothetical protein